MTAPTGTIANRVGNRERRWELIATVVLGVATLASAWGTFQSAKWGGVMSIGFSSANVKTAEAGSLYQLGDTKSSLDEGSFVTYLRDRLSGDEDVAALVRENVFSPELEAAMPAWEESDARTPFETEAYEILEYDDADALVDEATAASEDARDARQNGDNYILLTVLLASALFFAGVSMAVSSFTAQRALVVAASFITGGAIITMLTLPTQI